MANITDESQCIIRKRATSMTGISRCGRSMRQFWVPSWASLGSCVYCTRGAFRAAVIGWGLSGFIGVVGAPSHLLMPIGVVAFALTMLWLAHLLAHALKASTRWTDSTSRAGLSRRAMLPVFVRAFVSVAVVTSIPRLAFGQCSEESAAHCHSAELDCHAGCDRLFHRDERNHACHQECSSNSTECRATAGCR